MSQAIHTERKAYIYIADFPGGLHANSFVISANKILNMYFGLDQTPPCDENCLDCTYTKCVENPQYKSSKKHPEDYPTKTCAFCGQKYIPTSPGQIYCSSEENPECEYERFVSRLTPLGFIKFHGYRNKKEFIAEQGLDAWQALQKEK